jgi:hypothetical protein
MMKTALLFYIASCCVTATSANEKIRASVSGETHDPAANATLTGANVLGSCTICKAVVSKLVTLVAKESCAEIDVGAVAICEVILLGPEDPFADICAAAVVALCPVVSSAVAKHTVINSEKMCDQAHLCGKASTCSACETQGKAWCYKDKTCHDVGSVFNPCSSSQCCSDISISQCKCKSCGDTKCRV